MPSLALFNILSDTQFQANKCQCWTAVGHPTQLSSEHPLASMKHACEGAPMFLPDVNRKADWPRSPQPNRVNTSPAEARPEAPAANITNTLNCRRMSCELSIHLTHNFCEVFVKQCPPGPDCSAEQVCLEHQFNFSKSAIFVPSLPIMFLSCSFHVLFMFLVSPFMFPFSIFMFFLGNSIVTQNLSWLLNTCHGY